MLLKGEVMSSNNVKRINNLHVWLGGAHMRGVRVGALQSLGPRFTARQGTNPNPSHVRHSQLYMFIRAFAPKNCFEPEVKSSKFGPRGRIRLIWEEAITMEMAVQEAFDNTGRMHHKEYGLDDASFSNLFVPVIHKAVEVYRPEALVLHSRAYSLTGDALAKFNLFIKGHTACIVRSINAHLMVLGGEGHTLPNVARCWWSLSHLFGNFDYVFFSCWLVADSGCVVGEELDDKLPFNQYNGEFKHNKIVS
ncbi:unnamed protein product [Brassica oleracea]